MNHGGHGSRRAQNYQRSNNRSTRHCENARRKAGQSKPRRRGASNGLTSSRAPANKAAEKARAELLRDAVDDTRAQDANTLRGHRRTHESACGPDTARWRVGSGFGRSAVEATRTVQRLNAIPALERVRAALGYPLPLGACS